jgi:hypothetical protein
MSGKIAKTASKPRVYVLFLIVHRANLLVAGKDDFSPARRKRFVSKIA